MNFELLPVELIREIFEYLDGSHIYQTFYGLNKRLKIIASLAMNIHIDLRYLPLSTCLQILALTDRSQVISLKLANVGHHQDIRCIFQSYPLILFTHIRSLTFDCLTDYDLEQLIHLLPSLLHLESLTISSGAYRNSNIYAKLFYDLRHIRRFRLFSTDPTVHCLASVNIQSIVEHIPWALRHLQVKPLGFVNFEVLLHYLPHLRTIEADVFLGKTPTPYLPNLRSCILFINYSMFSDLAAFLRQCPNLRNLELETSREDSLDGHQWERLLVEVLCHLRHFKLVVDWADREYVCNNDDVERYKVNFRSPFWIQRRVQLSLIQIYNHIDENGVRTLHKIIIEDEPHFNK